jgi:micrococcal nuclease
VKALHLLLVAVVAIVSTLVISTFRDTAEPRQLDALEARATVETREPRHMDYTYDVQAARVVDGDTIEADLDLGFDLTYHADVRLVGVDTPEKSRIAQRPAAAKAQAFVQRWFEKNKGKVVCKSVKWDKYGGRVLGDFGTPSESSLSAAIIAAGYGRAYGGEKKPEWTPQELKRIAGLP